MKPEVAWNGLVMYVKETGQIVDKIRCHIPMVGNPSYVLESGGRYISLESAKEAAEKKYYKLRGGM
jgi:hypothetical protein